MGRGEQKGRRQMALSPGECQASLKDRRKTLEHPGGRGFQN